MASVPKDKKLYNKTKHNIFIKNILNIVLIEVDILVQECIKTIIHKKIWQK